MEIECVFKPLFIGHLNKLLHHFPNTLKFLQKIVARFRSPTCVLVYLPNFLRSARAHLNMLFVFQIYNKTELLRGKREPFALFVFRIFQEMFYIVFKRKVTKSNTQSKEEDVGDETSEALGLISAGEYSFKIA